MRWPVGLASTLRRLSPNNTPDNVAPRRVHEPQVFGKADALEGDVLGDRVRTPGDHNCSANESFATTHFDTLRAIRRVVFPCGRSAQNAAADFACAMWRGARLMLTVRVCEAGGDMWSRSTSQGIG